MTSLRSVAEIKSTNWFRAFFGEATAEQQYDASRIAYQLQHDNVAVITKKKAANGTLVWVVIADFYSRFNLMEFTDDSQGSYNTAKAFCTDMAWRKVATEDREFKEVTINVADFYQIRGKNLVEI